MGSVASNLTRITAAEAADDASWEDIGGGPGNSNSAEIFIQGSEAQARRVDNAEKGLSFDSVTGIDLSAADTLVGWWVTCLQPSQLGTSTNQDLEVRVGDNNSPTTSWDGWEALDSGNYPPTGGFVRVWIAINEITPDNGSGTPSYSSLRQFGINAHVGDVAGNAPNLICDAIDYLGGGGAALELTGTSSDFADLLSADEGTVGNKYGVWESRAGVLYCKARTAIGLSATSVDFDDSGFTVVFPLQQGPGSTNLVNADTNGLTFDLAQGATAIDILDGVIKSEDQANTPGDVQVNGTSGTFTATRVQFANLRIVDLTDAVTASNCVFANCGQIALTTEGSAGADISTCVVADSAVGTGVGAMLWDVNADPDGELDELTVSKGTAAHHAIEFGSNTPSSVTIRGWTTSGFHASNGNNDSTFYNDTGGALTINVIGGSGNFSYRNGSGASTTIVTDPVAATVTVLDEDANPVIGARVFMPVTSSAGGWPYQDTVTITRSGATATVTHTAHDLTTGDYVDINGANENEYNGTHQITVTGANTYTYTVSGTPATPATGTIDSTFVVIFGLTDNAGQISSTYAYDASQPVSVRIGRASQSYIQTVLMLQPDGYWPMDEASGSIIDRGSGGNDGTANGTPVYEVTGPIINGVTHDAITFDGSDEYFDLGASVDSGVGSTMTVAAWFATASNNISLATGIQGGSDDSFYFWLNSDGTIDFEAYQTDGSSLYGRATTASTYNDDAFHLVVGWIDGAGHVNIEVDGGDADEDTTTSGTWNGDSATAMRIGGLAGGSDFTGEAAHVAYWQRELIDAERTLLETGDPDLFVPTTQPATIDSASGLPLTVTLIKDE